MAMDTPWTDTYNNRQTVEGFMRETQRDLNDIHAAILGAQKSRIPGDKNTTNAANLWFDAGSWTNQTLGHVVAIRAALSQQQGASPQAIAEALRPALADLVGPVVRDAVTAALGADNQAQADAIVDQIATRLGEGQA